MLLFNISGNPEPHYQQGITHDIKAKDWSSDTIKIWVNSGHGRLQRDMHGNPLSCFQLINNIGVDSKRNTALANDFFDHAFWLKAHGENSLGYGPGEQWRIEGNGNFLPSIHGFEREANATTGILDWGGEIRATGEPPSPAAPGPLSAVGAGAPIAHSCTLAQRMRSRSRHTNR
jgi:hypothetical protein